MEFKFSTIQNQQTLEAYIRTLGVVPPYAAPPMQTPWNSELIRRSLWSGSGPYIYSIDSDKVKERSVPFIQYTLPNYADATTVDKMLHSYETIDTVITSDGSLVLRAKELPKSDFMIKWKILTVVDESELPQTLDDDVLSHCSVSTTLQGKQVLTFTVLNLLTKATTLLELPLLLATDTYEGVVPPGTLSKIERIFREVTSLLVRVSKIEGDVLTLDSRVTNSENQITSLINQVTLVISRLNNVDISILDLQNDVSAIKSKIQEIIQLLSSAYFRTGAPGQFKTTSVSVIKETPTLNLGAGVSANVTEAYPMANEESAGFITASDYASLKWAITQINLILTEVSSGVSTIWYQNIIGELFPTSEYLPTVSDPYPTLKVGSEAIVADYNGQGIRAHYICTSIEDKVVSWKFLYVDTQYPGIATLSVPGLVCSSTELGQVYVETDGKMSVLGYDELVQDIQVLTTQIDNINQLIASIQISINQLKASLESTQKTVSSHTEQLNIVNSKITDIENQLTEINTHLSNIDIQISTIDERINQIIEEISDIKSDIVQLGNRVSVIETTIELLDSRLSAVERRTSRIKLMNILDTLPSPADYEEGDKVFIQNGLVLEVYVKNSSGSWVLL